MLFPEQAELLESSSSPFLKGQRELYHFKGKSTLLDVELVSAMDEKEAMDLIRGEKLMITNLYREKATPYRGQITEVIKCNQKDALRFFKAQINGEEISVLEGYTNERKAYGVCRLKESSYKGAFVGLYNKEQKTLLKLKVFFHPQTTQDAIVSFLEKIKVRSW